MFAPKGEKSLREAAIDVIAQREPNEIITYDEIGEALGTAERAQIQSAVHSAKRGLLIEHQIAVESVRGVGYRVLEPHEHLRLAGGHQKKSSRALVRARNTNDYVDMNGLTEEQRLAATRAGQALVFLLHESRRLNIRQANLEDSLSSVVTRQDRTEDETSALKERMARLEAKLESVD